MHIMFTLKPLISADDFLLALSQASRGMSLASLAALLSLRAVQHHFPTLQPTVQEQQTAVKAFFATVLARLHKEDPRSAVILTERFLEGLSINKVALAHPKWGIDVIKKTPKLSKQKLIAIVTELEEAAVAEHQQVLLEQLGSAPYAHRVGTDALPMQLAQNLLGGRNVLITGIGGLGKTSLADATIRHALSHNYYHRLVKIVVPSGALDVAQLRHYMADALGIDSQISAEKRYARACDCLKTAAHLIFIDNIETDIAEWMAEMARMTNPSHFIITAREQPSRRGDLYVHLLQELTMDEAAELVRLEAERHQLTELAQANAQDIGRIYDVVGGNPLAIILIVGLTHFASLGTVLDDLPRANHSNIRDVYRRIYANVWRSLEDVQKFVLQIMAMAGESGAERQYIMNMVNEEWFDVPEVEMAVNDALAVLIQRSLLYRAGSVWDVTSWYKVHNLTKTFVQEDVLNWLDGESNRL